MYVNKAHSQVGLKNHLSPHNRNVIDWCYFSQTFNILNRDLKAKMPNYFLESVQVELSTLSSFMTTEKESNDA